MAASLCAFTSRQAEAMCLARPPAVAPRMQRLALAAQAAAEAPAAERPTAAFGPSLNCEDLPETALPSRRRARASRGHRRVKALGLPTLTELEGEPSAVDEQEPELEEALCGSDEVWSCAACTFMNRHMLPACEMCQTLRAAVPPKEPVDATQENFAEGWPSLQDAADSWAHCELSSVGSSWVDLDNVGDVVDELDEIDAMLVGGVVAHERPAEVKAPPSWAARIGATTVPSDACKVSAMGVAVPPPLIAQRARRRVKTAGDEDEEDLGLTELRWRKLQPQASRGTRSLLRGARQGR